ncbi:MAG: DUF523 domain-containing protein [Eggerthellaceae bacterium]
MMNIAVSNCLGARCRFDASFKTYPGLIELLNEHVVVPICPEEEGGLGCPRPPSEIDVAHGGERVINAEGADVTIEFREGSRLCIERAVEAGCTLAVLKSKSPACGVGEVYDGTFSGALVRGFGMAARAFCAAGIRVIDEKSFVRCLRASCSLREGFPSFRRSEQRPVLHGRGFDSSVLMATLALCARFAPPCLLTCWPTGSSVRRVHAFGVRSAAFRAYVGGGGSRFRCVERPRRQCMLRMRFFCFRLSRTGIRRCVSCFAMHSRSSGIEAPLPKRFFDESIEVVLHRVGFERLDERDFAQAPSGRCGKSARVTWRLALGFDGGFDLLPLC